MLKNGSMGHYSGHRGRWVKDARHRIKNKKYQVDMDKDIGEEEQK